jgi:hypothetical protein
MVKGTSVRNRERHHAGFLRIITSPDAPTSRLAATNRREAFKCRRRRESRAAGLIKQ